MESKNSADFKHFLIKVLSTLNALEEERGEKVRPRSEKKPVEESESNYDDEYDDVIEEENNNIDADSVSSLLGNMK